MQCTAVLYCAMQDNKAGVYTNHCRPSIGLPSPMVLLNQYTRFSLFSLLSLLPTYTHTHTHTPTDLVSIDENTTHGQKILRRLRTDIDGAHAS